MHRLGISVYPEHSTQEKDFAYMELAAKYGNPESDRAFQLNDYKDYLLNRYLEDVCVKA